MGRALRVAAVVLYVGWFLVLRPQALGGPAGWILVAGDSMEPNVHAGSLVVVMRRTEYRVGEVVAYRIPGSGPGAGENVIHRIVGGDPEAGFVMRGDNTNADDMWRPTPADIVGSAWLMVPGASSTLLFLRSPLLVASVAASIATYVALGVLAPAPNDGPGKTRQGSGRRRGVRLHPDAADRPA